MFDDVRFLVKQEQYRDMLKEAERERMLRRAAHETDLKENQGENVHERQPAPLGQSGLILAFRRLMSFML